ncbi:hypothetical protein TREAZ_2372 [Leadbettera azotonutricia ZAS-9]|uniref:Uncharacterized protein n=2 Tax=Leadbettera azotonutricia TaxID=150829 RepID=F5YGE5_LEAAZ|nr:hypothetical protein TREAZ_2372 [Leadbettera azotonutricia ZAS-9]
MPAVYIQEAKHAVELFVGYLPEYGLVPILELFMQRVMDPVDRLPFPGKPEIDFFLVVRLLVALDNPFF